MKHVEFLGIPGSGKTSLMSALVKSLNSGKSSVLTSDEVMSRVLCQRSILLGNACKVLKVAPNRIKQFVFRRLFLLSESRCAAIARFIYKHPDLSCKIFQMIDRSSQNEYHEKLACWFADLFALYQSSVDALDTDEIIVIDEGFANRALTLFGYDSDAAFIMSLKYYLSQVPLPDMVIAIDVPVEIAMERVLKRGLPLRMRNLKAEDQIKTLFQCQECVVKTARILEANGVSVLRIANTRTLQDAREEIVQYFDIKDG